MRSGKPPAVYPVCDRSVAKGHECYTVEIRGTNVCLKYKIFLCNALFIVCRSFHNLYIGVAAGNVVCNKLSPSAEDELCLVPVPPPSAPLAPTNVQSHSGGPADSSVGVFSKLKCKMGFHSGNYVYLRAGSCEQALACPTCGTTQTRIEHQHSSPQYMTPNSCVRHKVCSRCGHIKDAGVLHQMGPYVYTMHGSCTMAAGCARCGAIETTMQHEYGPWECLVPATGHYVSICYRCGDRRNDFRGPG